MLRKYAANLQEKHPYRSAISIKLLCNFIKITLRHGCSPLNLLHIFRTPLDGCFWSSLCFAWRSNTRSFVIMMTICFWQVTDKQKYVKMSILFPAGATGRTSHHRKPATRKIYLRWIEFWNSYNKDTSSCLYCNYHH